MLFLHFLDVQKYSPLNLSQVHLGSAKLEELEVLPLPFTGDGASGLALVGDRSSTLGRSGVGDRNSTLGRSG